MLPRVTPLRMAKGRQQPGHEHRGKTSAEVDEEAKAAEQAEADRVLGVLRQDIEQQIASVEGMTDAVGHLARYGIAARLERWAMFDKAINDAVNRLQAAHVEMRRAIGVLEAERETKRGG